MCRGVILCFLLSLAALPASSINSAQRYSNTAVQYTGAATDTLFFSIVAFMYLVEVMMCGDYSSGILRNKKFKVFILKIYIFSDDKKLERWSRLLDVDG